MKYVLGQQVTLTKIRPVVVCPEISSPAQSLASVINVPSNSCFPCRLAFCSFCFGSFGARSGSLRQQIKAKARQSRTTSRPAKNVNILESRKHHHFLSFRQIISGVTVDPNASNRSDVICEVGIVCDIPYKNNSYTKILIICLTVK